MFLYVAEYLLYQLISLDRLEIHMTHIALSNVNIAVRTLIWLRVIVFSSIFLKPDIEQDVIET